MAELEKNHEGEFKKNKVLNDKISKLNKQILLLNEIIDHIPYYNLLIGSNAQIIRYNDPIKELILKYHNGLCPDILYNLEFIPPDEFSKYSKAITSITNIGSVQSFNSTLIDLNNKLTPVNVYISPVKSDENILSIYINDQIRKPENNNDQSSESYYKEKRETLNNYYKDQIESPENYYKTIFDHNKTATVIIEENDIISLANSESAEIFGFNLDEVMDKKKWTDFVVPNDQPMLRGYQKLRYSNSTTAPNEYEFRIFDKNGNIKDISASICLIPGTKRTLASISDITKTKTTVEKLKESENKYRTLAEAVEEFVFIFDSDDTLEYVNEYTTSKLNIKPSHLLGKSRYELLNQNNLESLSSYIEKVFKTKNSLRIEILINRNEPLWLDTIIMPLKLDHGEVEKVLIVARDITKRKKYELLINSQNKILTCMKTILTKAITSETEEELTQTSLEVCEDVTQSQFGFICEVNLEEEFDAIAISKSVLPAHMVRDININPMLRKINIHKTCKDIIRSKEPVIFNELGKSGFDEFPAEHPHLKKLMVVPLLQKDDVIGIICLANKVNNYDQEDLDAIETISSTIVETIIRKRTEKKLKNTLNDKEMLVQEIHHRTKNNLMIMASLLNLTSADIKDEEIKQIFNQTQTRAKSMALIHEKLYQSDDYKFINFGDYIRHMVKDLSRSFMKDPEKISLTLELEDIKLDINIAIPLGLILNELLTNSMKYAFADTDYGNIYIYFYQSDNGYVMTVADDGIGLPVELDIDNTTTLGLQLVKNLVSQIEGDMVIDVSEGTAISIIFNTENKYS